MRVVHLTTVHKTFDTRIFRKECKSLSEQGHEVILVTPHDGSEYVDGVQIHGLPRPSGRFDRFTVTSIHAYRAALSLDADIYHFHDPELTLISLMLKAHGYVVVRDVHEDVALDIKTKYWIHPSLRVPVARFVRLVEALSTSVFDATVAATPAIADLFNNKQTVLVQNFPFIEELTPENNRPFVKRSNVVVYAGDLTNIRGTKQMVEAMYHISNGEATLKIAGSFSPTELHDEVSELRGWDCSNFLGWLEREEMANLLGSAMAGLVVFQPAPNHFKAQPNKLFEYMSAGLPVIASDFPLWRDIVGETECGILVDPTDPEAIASALCWIFEHPEEAEAMGNRGRAAIESRFNWSTEFTKLHNLYQRLLK